MGSMIPSGCCDCCCCFYYYYYFENSWTARTCAIVSAENHIFDDWMTMTCFRFEDYNLEGRVVVVSWRSLGMHHSLVRGRNHLHNVVFDNYSMNSSPMDTTYFFQYCFFSCFPFSSSTNTTTSDLEWMVCMNFFSKCIMNTMSLKCCLVFYHRY